MNSDATETGSTRSSSIRQVRPSRPTKPHPHPDTDAPTTDKASPAALDEVFAMLARNVERMQQSHARVRHAESQPVADEMPTATPATAAPTGVGTIPDAPRSSPKQSIDPSSFRSLAAEMDRQRERLAQLLRDIESATTAD